MANNLSSGYLLGQPASNAAMLDRALNTIKSEWRRFEIERAEWDVERIRLKAKLSASERRIEQLSSQCVASLKQIEILEALLTERGPETACGNSGPRAHTLPSGDLPSSRAQPRPGINSNSNEQPRSAADSISIAELVGASAKSREKSAMLLRRCLGEIDALLGSSPQSIPRAASPIPLSVPAAARAQRSRSVDLSAEPNGIIESEIAHPAPSWRVSGLVTAASATSPSISSATSAVIPAAGADGQRAYAEPRSIKGAAEKKRRSAQVQIQRPAEPEPPTDSESSTGSFLPRGHYAGDMHLISEPSAPGCIGGPEPAAAPAHVDSTQGGAGPHKASSCSRDGQQDRVLEGSDAEKGSDAQEQKQHQQDEQENDENEDEDEEEEDVCFTAEEHNSTARLHADLAHPQTAAMGRGFGGLTVDELDGNTGIATDSTTRRQLESRASWAVHKTFYGHLDTVRAIKLRNAAYTDAEIGSSGPQMLSGSDDGLVMLWDATRSNRHRSRKRHDGDVAPSHIYRGHLAAVTSVEFAESHAYAYSGSLDSSIKVWSLPADDRTDGSDTEMAFPVREFAGHTDSVWDLALSTKAGVLASVSADASCRIWSIDPRHGNSPLRKTFVARSSLLQPMVPTSACFANSSGSRLVVAYANGCVNVFDLGSLGNGMPAAGNACNSRIPRITQIACRPAFSENVVAAACVDGSIRVLDMRATGRPLTLFEGSVNQLKGMSATAAAPAGTTGSAKSGAIAVDLVPNNPYALVAGSSGGAVQWWDWRNPNASTAFNIGVHDNKADEGVCAVQAVRALGGELQVASAGADGLAYLYKMNG
ncbi:1,2-dihydroxy-3-keto-5-methylthiopentene dioxygenase [Coemansia sp. Benny D115]|nr:1,2-dihydroxy-3-keto-5-methylthiopentene dioxygenase [Coemansia sp. Benny D115]